MTGSPTTGPSTIPDGFAVLETLLWTPDGGFWFLPEHLARLQTAALHFYRRHADLQAVGQRLDALAADCAPVPHRVRLLVDQTFGIDVRAAPLDRTPPPERVTLARARAPLVGNPYVTHKTTHREVYQAALDAARAAVPDADDVLLLNERGEVTESTIANLVVALDGRLVTPPRDAGLLPGVYRQHLLDTGQIDERCLRVDDLRRADVIYLANSVRGLWPVVLREG